MYKHSSMLSRRYLAVLVVLTSLSFLLCYWKWNELDLQARYRIAGSVKQCVETETTGQPRGKASREDDDKFAAHRKVQFRNEFDGKLSEQRDVNRGNGDEEKRNISDNIGLNTKHKAVSSSPNVTDMSEKGKQHPNLHENKEPSTEISEIVLREQRWNEALASCANQTKERRLPDIIGIGTEKCGTHALNQFLSYHPLIRINEDKLEAHFFEGYKAKLDLDYYKSLMPEAEKCALVMEKTPAYFSFPPEEIPQRIKKSVPNAKLLLILCDPAKRAFSDFVHEWEMKKLGMGSAGLSSYDEIEKYLKVYLPMAFKKIRPLNDTKPYQGSKEILVWLGSDYISHILTAGLYAHHLKRWLRFYNETKLMIIDGEELFQDPGGLIEKVQNFLEIPKLILRSDFVKDPSTGYYCYREWRNEKMRCLPSSKQRTRGGKRKLKPETLLMLKSFYQRHNENLFKLLGRHFNW